MKIKHIACTLLVINIFLIASIISLKLRYEVDEFASESFIHQKPDQERFEFHWPKDKKMALSLTFDDARISQIDSGIPLLDTYNVKATFYVSPVSLIKKLEDWKSVANNGHEIGNHTVHHPCSNNYDFGDSNSLENYTLAEIQNELVNENVIINTQLGITPVSFAYPCGQTFIGDGVNTKSYVPLVSVIFKSGRLYSGGTVNPVFCDMAKLPSENLDNVSFEQIKDIIEKAKNTGKWLILTGHEIGEGNMYQTSSKKVIEEICKYALDPSNGIWIDNVHNISSYILEKRSNKPFLYLSQYQKTTSSTYSKLYSIFYISKMRISHYKYKLKQKLGLAK